MSTLAETEAAVPVLTTAELQHLEQTLHRLYRERGDAVVFDDKYGVVTEADLIAAADAAFCEYDREEAAADTCTPARCRSPLISTRLQPGVAGVAFGKPF